MAAPTSVPLMECARIEQIIAQFIQKSLLLILDARIPSAAPKPRPSAAAASRKKDKWFQLDLWDVLDASSCPWHHPILDPMLVDIFLLPDPDPDPHPDPYNPRPAAKETVLERWVVQYEPLPTPSAAADSGGHLVGRMYKKMLILMRSLYSALRFLPAYRVYRMRRCGDVKVSYRVSSFGEPFTRAEEEGMRVQGFAPVEAAHGRLSVSVTYRANLSDLNLEPSSSYPPQIIADYVGSPAAEPIKIFHSSGAYSPRLQEGTDRRRCRLLLPCRSIAPTVGPAAFTSRCRRLPLRPTTRRRTSVGVRRRGIGRSLGIKRRALTIMGSPLPSPPRRRRLVALYLLGCDRRVRLPRLTFLFL